MDAQFVRGTILLGVHFCDLQPNAVVSSQGLLLRCTIGQKTVETPMVYSPLAHIPWEIELELPTDPSTKFLTLELIDNNTWIQSRSVGKVTLTTSATSPPLQKTKQYNMFNKNILTASLTITLSLRMDNNIMLSEQNRHLYYPLPQVLQGENPNLDCFSLELDDDDFMYLSQDFVGLPGQPAPAKITTEPSMTTGPQLKHSNPRLVAPYMQSGNLFHNLHLQQCVAATTVLQHQIANHHNTIILGSNNNTIATTTTTITTNNGAANNMNKMNDNAQNLNAKNQQEKNQSKDDDDDDDDFEVVDYEDTQMNDNIDPQHQAYTTTCLQPTQKQFTQQSSSHQTGYGYPTIDKMTGKILPHSIPPQQSYNNHQYPGNNNASGSNSLNNSGNCSNGSYTGSNTSYPTQQPVPSINPNQNTGHEYRRQQQYQQQPPPPPSSQYQQYQQHQSQNTFWQQQHRGNVPQQPNNNGISSNGVQNGPNGAQSSSNGPIVIHNTMNGNPHILPNDRSTIHNDASRVDLPYRTEHGGFGIISLPGTHPLAQHQLLQNQKESLPKPNPIRNGPNSSQNGPNTNYPHYQNPPTAPYSGQTTAQIFSNAHQQHNLHTYQQQQLLRNPPSSINQGSTFQQYPANSQIYTAEVYGQQQNQQPQQQNNAGFPFPQFNTINNTSHTAPPPCRK